MPVGHSSSENHARGFPVLLGFQARNAQDLSGANGMYFSGHCSVKLSWLCCPIWFIVFFNLFRRCTDTRGKPKLMMSQRAWAWCQDPTETTCSTMFHFYPLQLAATQALTCKILPDPSSQASLPCLICNINKAHMRLAKGATDTRQLAAALQRSAVGDSTEKHSMH